jgi:hypothetical protein
MAQVRGSTTPIAWTISGALPWMGVTVATTLSRPSRQEAPTAARSSTGQEHAGDRQGSLSRECYLQHRCETAAIEAIPEVRWAAHPNGILHFQA